MGKDMELFSKISGRLAFLDGVLGWLERSWAWLPALVRKAIGAGVIALMAWASGMVAAFVVWLGTFATEYGALAVLTILGAAGAATQFRGLAERVVGSMDRLSESRATEGLTPAVAELVTLNAIRELHRGHTKAAGSLLVNLLDSVFRDGLYKATLASLLTKEIASLKKLMSDMEAAIHDQHPFNANEARVLMAMLHETYMESVGHLHDSEKEGVDLVEGPYSDAYRMWETAHDGYLKKLGEIKEHAEMLPVRQAIDRVGLEDASEQRYASAYKKAMRRMEDLTLEEGHFLGLFSAREDDTGEATWGGWPMPNDVYMAGRRLVQDRFLASDPPKDGIQRFTIPAPVWRAWNMGGPINNPVRRSIELDLSRVVGTGSTGSGAGQLRINPKLSAPRTEEPSHPEPEEEDPEK